MRSNHTLLAVTMVAVMMSSSALAQGPGGMMGSGTGGAMAGGAGMLVVADDGSLLVTEMAGGMMMGGGYGLDRSLKRITSGGAESWSVSFDDGWPMMPVTDGDLVVLVLRDDWFMGFGGSGDGSWGGGSGDGDHLDRSILRGLDLATGAERWSLELEGDMVSPPSFSPDGARMYMTTRDFADGSGPGHDPRHQGDTVPASMMMETTVVAIDRNGLVLWSLDISGGGMGGPQAAGMTP